MADNSRPGLGRHLRAAATDAEAQLWFHLRNRQLSGYKFRRQYQVGPYVVDFLCHEAALVIEVDGAQHLEREAEDEARTQYLESLGLRVIRFNNAEVLNQTQLVLEAILLKLQAPPHPSPLPRGRGDQLL